MSTTFAPLLRRFRLLALVVAPAVLALASEARAADAPNKVVAKDDEGGTVNKRVRIGADFVGTFPVGPTAEVGDPALGVQGSFLVLLKNGLGIGITGGRVATGFQTMRRDTGTLTTITGGPSIRYEALRWPWHTRPFIGLDLGYASLKGSKVAFDPPNFVDTAHGIYAAPRIGLRGIVGGIVGFEASFVYQHLYTMTTFVSGNLRLHHLTGLGLTFGSFLAF